MNFSKEYFIDKKDAELAYNFRRLSIRTFVLIIIFLAAVYLINYNQKKELTTAQLLAHTENVISQTEHTISLVKDYETIARGFIITNNEDFLTPVTNTKDSLKKTISNLRNLIKDNLIQQTRIDSLAGYISKKFFVLDHGIELRRDSGLDAVLKLAPTGKGKKYMDTIRMIGNNIQQQEGELLVKRSAENKHAIFINRVTLFVCLLIFFILLIILFWQAGFNLKKYNNRQKEVNSILRQLAGSLMEAQKIAHLGSWEWDIEKNVEKWSDEQFRIFGLEPGSIKVTHELFLDAIHPGDRANVELAIAAAVNTQQLYNTYFRIVQPDGNVRHVHAMGKLYTENGKVCAMAGTTQDITAEVINEKEKTQLAKILHKSNKAARIGWWETDLVTGKRKWSSVTKEIMEVDLSFEPENNFDFLFINNLHSREKMKQVFSNAVLYGTPYDIEFDTVTLKGNLIKVRAIGQPEFEDGKCVKVYGIFQQLASSKQHQPQ